MKRKLLMLTVVALAVLGGSYGTKTAHAENTHVMCPGIIKGIEFYRQAVWGWQGKLGVAKTNFSSSRFNSCSYAKWVAHKWVKEAHALRIKYIAYKKAHANSVRVAGYGTGLPPHAAGWICIHNLEGAWNANTGNGYFGGLQAHYDWYGVARMDLLSPGQQMWHAEHVAAANGFSYSFMQGQWPNTFPPCAGYF